MNSVWPTVRLKFLALTPMAYGANEAGLEDDPQQPRFIRITDIDLDGSLRPDTFRSLPRETARDYLLEDGDLLFARSGATVGKAFLYDRSWGEACFAGYLIRFRSDLRRVLPRFLFYFTQGADYWAQIGGSKIQATIQNVSAEKYGDVVVPLPPLAEQRRVTEFLDRETARLDALLAEKERLVALLGEKRRALITRAVTRGLDPAVPLRDSGISWLGFIPEHWEIWKVAHFATVGNGSTPSRDNVEYWQDGSIPWLNSAIVNRQEATRAEQFVTELARRECHLPIVPSGSLLVAITGQGKTRGSAVVLSFDATINQHLAYITPEREKADPWFLRWLFFSAYEFLRAISDDVGGTKGALTCEELRTMRVPLPPMSEQRAIVAWIARETAKLDALQGATERTVALLRERRVSLIASAVTGQLAIGS